MFKKRIKNLKGWIVAVLVTSTCLLRFAGRWYTKQTWVPRAAGNRKHQKWERGHRESRNSRDGFMPMRKAAPKGEHRGGVAESDLSLTRGETTLAAVTSLVIRVFQAS